MSDQEVVIKDIVFKIGDREITLSIKEAKELKIALETIFDKEVIKETTVIHQHEWVQTPYLLPYPIYTGHDDWFGDKYKVTCYGYDKYPGVEKGNNTMCLEIKV